MNVIKRCCLKWGILCTVACLGLPGYSTSAQTQNGGGRTPFPGQQKSRYLLRAGDVLDLTFPLAPDFNQTLSVQPDGYLGLRSAGEVKVAGMALPEVEDCVRTAYARIMKDPQFSLTLKDFAKPFYIVAGEVKSPGTKELRGDVTVMQALMSTGGFTADAKHSRVLVFRRVSNQWYEVKELDAKHMLSSGNLNEDFRVQEGDIIFVPKSTFGKVNRFIPVYSLSSYMGAGAL